MTWHVPAPAYNAYQLDRPIKPNSQGGVQFPTGGIWRKPAARERLVACMASKVSRSGAMPEPTVIVRMKENRAAIAWCAAASWAAVRCGMALRVP